MTRRQLLKGALAVGGVFAITASGISLLSPEEADALSLPVNFQVIRRIDYGASMFTNEFRVNGSIGFCVNPTHPAPPTGIYGNVQSDVAWDSAPAGDSPGALVLGRRMLRNTLWYGVDGPGERDDFWPSTWWDGTGLNRDRRIVFEHILLSDLYSWEGPTATAGLTSSQRTWIYNNVTGIPSGSTETNPWSARAHAMGTGGFADCPDSFKTYLMIAGTSPSGIEWQRIMFFENNGKLQVHKSPSNPSWL